MENGIRIILCIRVIFLLITGCLLDFILCMFWLELLSYCMSLQLRMRFFWKIWKQVHRFGTCVIWFGSFYFPLCIWFGKLMKIPIYLIVIFLLLLMSIGGSLFLAEKHLGQSNEFIILISFFKFILIAYFFMDLKNAHLFWKIVMLALGIILSSMVQIL